MVSVTLSLPSAVARGSGMLMSCAPRAVPQRQGHGQSVALGVHLGTDRMCLNGLCQSGAALPCCSAWHGGAGAGREVWG